MIDRALRSGANNVTDVRFALRDNWKQCAGLLVKAAWRAQSDAETVAKAMMSMDGAEPATPIEAGALALTGQV
jgi:uncharacterized protein YggE